MGIEGDDTYGLGRQEQNSKVKKQEGISWSQSDTVARIPAGPVSQSCRRITASKMLPDVFNLGGGVLISQINI